jgi:hypothetical protein
VHVLLSVEAAEALDTFVTRQGLTITALIEALALEVAEGAIDRPTLSTKRVIERGRQIASDHRRRPR